MRVLLLAGTTEARELAGLLAAEPGIEVTASLAGHTAEPQAYPCAVRTGGFGGIDGLADHLRAHAINALVDASHPFSRVLPANAVTAATGAGVPHLRLLRPPWQATPEDSWIDAEDMVHAARLVEEQSSSSVLLTVGRLELAPFAAVRARFVIRTIEPPDLAPLGTATVILDRGPFDLRNERRLLEEHAIDLIVTKNSGGDPAKLLAARTLGVPVIMVQRPASVDSVTPARTAPEALRWLLDMSGGL